VQTLLILLKLVIYKPVFLVSLENKLNSSKQEDCILKYLDRWWNHFCNRAWLKSIAAKPKTEEGQGLVEYALILLLVVIVVIVILSFLGPQLGSMFSAVTKGLS
jgi:pilus assembly protein Flp/PilA